MRASRFVMAAVVLQVVLRVIVTGLNLILVVAYPGTIDTAEPMEGTAFILLMLLGLGAILLLVIMVFSLPIWGYWHYHAGQNLEILGREGLAYGPAGHIGWWFVPFANLIVPYRCMAELYRRSRPGDEIGPVPSRMPTWWGCWLGSNIATNIANRIGESGMVIEVPAVALGVYAAYLYVTWVREITELQEQAHILEA